MGWLVVLLLFVVVVAFVFVAFTFKIDFFFFFGKVINQNLTTLCRKRFPASATGFPLRSNRDASMASFTEKHDQKTPTVI